MPIDVNITQAMNEGSDVVITAERDLGEGRRQVVQITVPAADLTGMTGAQQRAHIIPLLRTAFVGPTAPTQRPGLRGSLTLPD